MLNYQRVSSILNGKIYEIWEKKGGLLKPLDNHLLNAGEWENSQESLMNHE